MSWWTLFFHLVWATRGRERLITQALEPMIHRQLREIAQHHGIGVYAVEGVEDHVHMAVSIPPSLSVAAAIKRIKGASSHAINQAVDEAFGWQGEYGVDTFSERHLPRVIAYIDNQHRHHAEKTLWPSIEEIPVPSDEEP
ncbi:MAG TPA: IS200/IS605 family transposase [Nitrolancea sp.]|nr:IS200/IS605 family transposase [Nitrolancea sp.]